MSLEDGDKLLVESIGVFPGEFRYLSSGPGAVHYERVNPKNSISISRWEFFGRVWQWLLASGRFEAFYAFLQGTIGLEAWEKMLPAERTSLVAQYLAPGVDGRG